MGNAVNYFKARVRIVAGAVEMCWICSRPLGAEGIDAVLDGDIVTVHTFCADVAWGDDEQWAAGYLWCKAEKEWREANG